MVQIFEKMKPKINSTNRNQQKNSLSNFQMCPEKVKNFITKEYRKIQLLASYPKICKKFSDIGVDLNELFWKSWPVDGLRLKFSKYLVSKSDF